jgi:hypothetical protein
MKRIDLSGARRVASPRHRRVRYGTDGTEYLLLLLRLASVGLLIALAWVHFHLWEVGYRHIPTIGPLFLITAISGSAVALGLFVRPSRLVAVLGLGSVLGVMAGLIVSVNVGLFGFSESFSAPYVIESVALEVAAVITLSSWVVMDFFLDSRQGMRATLPRWRVARSFAGVTNRTTTSS